MLSQCSLISAFVIHSLESMIAKFATHKISRFLLVSAVEQASFGMTWQQIPKIDFLPTRLILLLCTVVEIVDETECDSRR